MDAGQSATLVATASAGAAGALAALAAWSGWTAAASGRLGRGLIGLLAAVAAAGALAALWWPAWGWVVLAAAAWVGALALASHAWRTAWQQREEARRQLAQREAEFDETRAQLQQALSAAEAAEQSRARFLAAASHDLRQPAHALGLYTAALRAGPLAPAQAEIAERMQGSLAALDGLFAALMDLSRIDAGAVLPQWDTVALAPLLRRLADEWAPQAEAKGLRLALHVSDPTAHAVTDLVLLERVVRNLLGNAVKYTAEGGVLLALRLRHTRQGQGQLRIEVWDSGVGIPAGDQDRVFEEFFQRPDPQSGAGDRRAGLGLGLAIVQRLARLLQLHVRLHSRPGQGSVFFVEGLSPAGPVPRAAASSRRTARRLVGLAVAVLEDDADVRDAMRRLLQLWECRVVDGADADELQARLPAAPWVPDVLMADLRLADGRTGVAEAQRLQQAWGRAVPVLWISGETAHDGLRATLPEGATVLTKPVSPARVRAWLEQRLPEGAPGDLP